MRFRHLGCRTLSAMTNYTAPLLNVVANRRMWPKRSGDSRRALQTGLRDCQVARRAAIHHTEFRQPHLLNSAGEMALQGSAIRPGGNEFHVLPLVVPPFFEKVLGRCNRKGDQQEQAGPGKTIRRRNEEKPPQPPGYSLGAQEFLQGHTQTQPGPRKSAPTVVRITASIRNQVMIQNDRDLALNQWRNCPPCGPGHFAARTIRTPMVNTGRRASHAPTRSSSAVKVTSTTASTVRRRDLFRAHSVSSWIFTLKKGTTISASKISVGKRMPATNGGK